MKPFVIIADDEFGFADVVASVLNDRGYETEIAINGKRALASLEKRLADLVITDVMMPIVDGPALLAAIRADARLARVPVVLMTAMPESIPAYARDASDAVLVKPFRFDQMFGVIDRLLAR